MWRRVGLLSHLISSSSRPLLDHHHHHLHHQLQTPYGMKFVEIFTTEIEKQAMDGVSCKQRSPFITFVLGGPGSGKGTQCIKIVETFGFTHLSAGDLLRKEISSEGENGAMIRDTIKEGKIVPSEITIKLIQRAIESSKNHKFLIDGFPRSDENRVAFERIMRSKFIYQGGRDIHHAYYEELVGAKQLHERSLKVNRSPPENREAHQIGVEPDMVLFFDCPEEDMVKRVLHRNEGRIDDNIETVKKRLKAFSELNLPVINHYSGKGKVHKIDAVGAVEEIFEKVRPLFAAHQM